MEEIERGDRESCRYSNQYVANTLIATPALKRLCYPKESWSTGFGRQLTERNSKGTTSCRRNDQNYSPATELDRGDRESCQRSILLANFSHSRAQNAPAGGDGDGSDGPLSAPKSVSCIFFTDADPLSGSSGVCP